MYLSKKFLVRDVFNRDVMFSLVVDEDETVVLMIKTFAEKPSLRGIFVVDKEKRFKGVITRRDLLTWVRAQLGLSIPRSEVSQATRLSNIFSVIIKYAYASTARELVRKYSNNSYVKPEDSLVYALNLMVSSDLIDIPVIDEEGRIMGDLKLNEILNIIIDTK